MGNILLRPGRERARIPTMKVGDLVQTPHIRDEAGFPGIVPDHRACAESSSPSRVALRQRVAFSLPGMHPQPGSVRARVQPRRAATSPRVPRSRLAGEGWAVLLAPAGGRSSAPAAVRRQAAEPLGATRARRIAGSYRPRACSSGHEARGARCRDNGPGRRIVGRFHVVVVCVDGDWEIEEHPTKKPGRLEMGSVFIGPDSATNMESRVYTPNTTRV